MAATLCATGDGPPSLAPPSRNFSQSSGLKTKLGLTSWRRLVTTLMSSTGSLEASPPRSPFLPHVLLSVLTRYLEVSAFGGLDIFKAENKPSQEDLEKYLTWTQAYEHVDPFSSEKDIDDNIVAILQYRNGVKVD